MIADAVGGAEMLGVPLLIAMVTDAVLLPPPLAAVMVYEAELDMAVGVPLINPELALRERPAGSDGLTE